MRPEALLQRLIQLIPVLLGITVIVFLLMHITPGDPVDLMIGDQHVAEGEIENLRRELGLDRPIYVQFLHFMGGVLRGDFGNSFSLKRPAMSVILEHLPATIELTLLSMLIALLIAIPVGVLSAVRQYSVADRTSTLFALLGVSMPGFWLGLVLIVIFAVHLELLPVAGRIEYDAGLRAVTGFYLIDSLLTGNLPAFVNALKHLLMPAVTLGTAMSAVIMRTTRSSMLDVIRQDYVLCARSKGLGEWRVIWAHALRNALIPTITVTAIQAGRLLSGNVVVETVFAWPGIGRLVVEAIWARDYPLVQGVVFIYAVSFVAMNFLADVLYTLVNPRVEL